MTPSFLKSGDTVAIVSTARKISEEDLKAGIEILKWGLNTSFGKNLFQSLNQFAGTDEQRAEDFQNALDDKNVKAIWLARGGYGTVRVIDKIDWTGFKKNPKWIIGYSDATVIHSHVERNCAIETLHAPMIFNLGKITNEALSNLKKIIFGEKIKYSFEENIYSDINRFGNAEGELIGGNLSILYSLLGSNSDIDTKGKILFIEDLDEYLYHVDRMMYALKRANKLSNLVGLIVGGMSEMKDNKVRFNKTAEEIICESAAEFSFPILFGFPAGHIRNNNPLIFGSKISMKVNVESEIFF
jgi:muramoyltetrapeptide carboxypeptidase